MDGRGRSDFTPPYLADEDGAPGQKRRPHRRERVNLSPLVTVAVTPGGSDAAEVRGGKRRIPRYRSGLVMGRWAVRAMLSSPPSQTERRGDLAYTSEPVASAPPPFIARRGPDARFDKGTIRPGSGSPDA